MSRKILIVTILVILLVLSSVFTYLLSYNNKETAGDINNGTENLTPGDELYVIRDNGRYGYINSSGFVVIKPRFEDAYDFSEGLARIAVQHKYGFSDQNGNIVIEPVFDDAGDFTEGLARVSIDNKYGFIDKNGNAVIPLEYELVSEFSDGLAAIYVGGKWGYINQKGAVVIAPSYNNAGPFSEGLAPVSEKDLYGYIDKTGQYVIKPKFNYANSFSEGLALIGINNIYGYIDANGKTVIKTVFKSAFDFEGGLAAAMKDGKWGYIDKKGSFIIAPTYEAADIFSEDRAAVYDGKLWGFIDSKGAMSIKPQYSYVERFRNGLVMVRMEDSLSYVDKNGKLVWHEVEEARLHGPDGLLGRMIKMKIKSDKYDLMIKYPYVIDMKDKALQKKINQLLKQQSGIDYKGQPKEIYRQDYDVMLNKQGIVSILNNSYMYMEGAAHGMSMRSAINMDMTDGRLYSLKDLFRPGVDYKGKLSAIIKKKLAEDNIPLLREFEGITSKQEYYLLDNELVIYYQLYDYTPYAYGFLEFFIPYKSIMDYIDKKGPITRILEEK